MDKSTPACHGGITKSRATRYRSERIDGEAKKETKSGIIGFEKRIHERLDEKQKRRIACAAPPRYDDVFFSGIEWLITRNLEKDGSLCEIRDFFVVVSVAEKKLSTIPPTFKKGKMKLETFLAGHLQRR